MALAGSIITFLTAHAQQGNAVIAPVRETSSNILISNVRIFDGINDQLRPGNVLIEDRKIKRISSTPIAAPPNSQPRAARLAVVRVAAKA